MEGPDTVDPIQSLGVTGGAQERIRTIAHHLCSGKSLISVHTHNVYEIATILEIFHAGGAVHCAHIVEDGGSDDHQSLDLTTTVVHDHTTILNDRVRESA